MRGRVKAPGPAGGSRRSQPSTGDQLFFLVEDDFLLAIFSSSDSLMPVCVFLPSRFRSSSAPMKRRCFSVLAGTDDLPAYLFRTLSALRSIFASSLLLRLPFLTCCDARALAFRACDLSGIGYLRSSGRPNCDSLSLSRSFSSSSGMGNDPPCWRAGRARVGLRSPSPTVGRARDVTDRGGDTAALQHWVADRGSPPLVRLCPACRPADTDTLPLSMAHRRPSGAIL